MNHYEILAIISGKYAETELEALITKFTDLITKHKGTIHYTQNVGRRKLAYPIKHLAYGYYFLTEFDADATDVAKLNRDLTLSSELLRHLITRRDTVGTPRQIDHRDGETEQRERTEKTSSEIPAELKKIFSTDTLLKEEAQEKTAAPATTPETAEQPAEVTAPSVTPETVVIAEEPKTVAVKIEESVTEEKIDTEDAEEEKKSKKKDSKVSYEDLDKKLDELLKNDIL